METLRSVPSGPENVANFVFTTEVKPLRKHLKAYVRENRKAPTPAENILWQKLRGSKLESKFRRQHAINFFIIDFFLGSR